MTENNLKKGQICIHCEHMFKCKGSVEPGMCLNYKPREEKPKKFN